MNLEGLCKIGRITTKKFNPSVEKILAEQRFLCESEFCLFNVSVLLYIDVIIFYYIDYCESCAH